MKNLIKNILKESVMEKLIGDVFPYLNNLKTKSNHSAKLFGYNVIYYNKDDKNYYFRVSEPSRRLVWVYDGDDEPTIDHKNFPKTLYMDGRTYDTLYSYIPNKDIILKWFNERYNQDAEVLVRKSPLKGL